MQIQVQIGDNSREFFMTLLRGLEELTEASTREILSTHFFTFGLC